MLIATAGSLISVSIASATTTPTLTSATIFNDSQDRTILKLSFDEAVQTGYTDDSNNFTSTTGDFGVPHLKLYGIEEQDILRNGNLTSGPVTLTGDDVDDWVTDVVGQDSGTSPNFFNSVRMPAENWYILFDEEKFQALEPASSSWGSIELNSGGVPIAEANGGDRSYAFRSETDPTVTASHGTVTVTNNSTAQPPAPDITSASINSDGDKITVSIDEEVKPTADGFGDWSFFVDEVELKPVGTPVNKLGTPDSTSLDNEWVFTLPNPVRKNQTVYIQYAADGTSLFESSGGTDLTPVSDKLTTVTTSGITEDTTDPTIDSASLAADGTTLTVTFSEEMGPNSPVAGFTVNVDGSAVTASIADIAAYDTTVVITLSEAVTTESVLTLDYSATTGSVADVQGRTLKTPAQALSVTNSSQVAPPSSTPAPAPPYTGPLVTGSEQKTDSEFATAGQETVVITGERLGTVSKVTVDGIEAEILNVTANSFEIAIPASLAAGTYDLQIESGIGNLTYLDGLTVTESTQAPEVNDTETDVVETEADAKVNAGSFKGFVAVYAKGHEGKRLSAKVGNDWVIIPELESNFERIVEFIGSANVDLNVRIYIDRVLTETIPVTTRM
jgi:hypothetical protein